MLQVSTYSNIFMYDMQGRIQNFEMGGEFL